MKILVGSLTYPLPNGVTNSINVSLDGFKEAGHELIVVAPDYGTGKFRPEHYPVASSRILEIVSGSYGNGERFFSLKAAGQIQRIIAELNPDAYWLHTVTWAPNIFEVIMAQQRKPRVVTYHTNIDYYGRVYAGAVGEKHMAERSREVCQAVEQIIVPSHQIEEKLRALDVSKPIAVIPTGIPPAHGALTPKELRQRYSIPQENKVLLFTGRLVREKNISGLIQMMADLCKLRSDVSLLLIGPGVHKDFETEAESLGVKKNIVMAGQASAQEVRRHYPAADAFVSASQHETQGLVIGEAMYAGLPVIALDSPIREEFYPQSVAVVVSEQASFAASVNKVLNDEKLALKLTEAGKKFFAKNFAVQLMIDRQIKLFNSVVGPATPKPPTS
ncbi:MAG: glycosyltransferase [Candidatus Berkelbacteria bacterium]|nr:MAG: glycosyltransferase [Candidatus Berkelbacteria bacterium]QQG51856.1 MAG: glycosyltransferase [Candidatus Berkelbacteria bacterium]